MNVYRHAIGAITILFFVIPCAAADSDPIPVEPNCNVFKSAGDPTVSRSVCQIIEDYTPFGSPVTGNPDSSLPVEAVCESRLRYFGSTSVIVQDKNIIVRIAVFVVPDVRVCRTSFVRESRWVSRQLHRH
jgi:hypothetical protein